MDRVVNIAKSHKQARKHDIQQAVNLSSEERQAIAKELRKRAFGADPIDVRVSKSCHVEIRQSG